MYHCEALNLASTADRHEMLKTLQKAQNNNSIFIVLHVGGFDNMLKGLYIGHKSDCVTGATK